MPQAAAGQHHGRYHGWLRVPVARDRLEYADDRTTAYCHDCDCSHLCVSPRTKASTPAPSCLRGGMVRGTFYSPRTPSGFRPRPRETDAKSPSSTENHAAEAHSIGMGVRQQRASDLHYVRCLARATTGRVINCARETVQTAHRAGDPYSYRSHRSHRTDGVWETESAPHQEGPLAHPSLPRFPAVLSPRCNQALVVCQALPGLPASQRACFRR